MTPYDDVKHPLSRFCLAPQRGYDWDASRLTSLRGCSGVETCRKATKTVKQLASGIDLEGARVTGKTLYPKSTEEQWLRIWKSTASDLCPLSRDLVQATFKGKVNPLWDHTLVRYRIWRTGTDVGLKTLVYLTHS